MMTTKVKLFGEEANDPKKSVRSRAALLEAAVTVFARDGFEQTSVNEISRAADLTKGAFYQHFRDKDEVAGIVALKIAMTVVAELNGAMSEISDPIERVGTATRGFIELAYGQQDWGWALCRGLWAMPYMRQGVETYLRADLQRGVEAGVFTIPMDDFVVDTFAVMVLAALFMRLTGMAGPDAGVRVAELQLRMLGVDPDTAKAAALGSLSGICGNPDEPAIP
jgi:AcrR family transcriptional regulator